MDFALHGECLLRVLREEGARLVVWRDGHVVYRSDERGIKPWLDALEEGTIADALNGAWVADRVIGKAVALLIALAGSAFVAGEVVSDSAAEVLRRAGIPLHAERRVTRIQGRIPGRPCPFETAVAGIDDPSEAHRRLRRLAVDILGVAPRP